MSKEAGIRFIAPQVGDYCIVIDSPFPDLAVRSLCGYMLPPLVKYSTENEQDEYLQRLGNRCPECSAVLEKLKALPPKTIAIADA